MTTRAEIIDTIADRLHGNSRKATAEAIWRKLQGLLAFPEDHLIECDSTGWTLSHPIYCRPEIWNCPFNHYIYAYTEREELPLGRNVARWENDTLVLEPVEAP